MSKDLGINPRSALSQGFSIGAPIWSTVQIDSISSVFDCLQNNQQISNNDLDFAVEQLARGIDTNSSDSQVYQLIVALCKLTNSSSPNQEARIIGLLLAPQNSQFLEQLFNNQDVGAVISSPLQSKLLEISKEPNLAVRIVMLVDHFRQSADSKNHSHIPDQQSVRITEGAFFGKNVPKEDQENKIDYSGEGGTGKDALLNGHTKSTLIVLPNPQIVEDLSSAISKHDIPSLTMILTDASARGDLWQTINGLDPQTQQSLKTVLRQLIIDPNFREQALSALQILDQNTAMNQNDGSRLPPIMNSNVVDTSRLENLLLSPDTLPATLGLLTKMGTRGQASLCELLMRS